MRYRNLGRTGIQVSPYALGALMFATRVGNADPEDSIRIIHKALDAGINLIDTADAYGDSEEVVGRALKGSRDNVVLATKFSRPMGTDPNQQGASRRWIITAVENSLRRLQTGHIDVYQVHRPDPGTDIEETLSVLYAPGRHIVRSAIRDDAGGLSWHRRRPSRWRRGLWSPG
jgi:aryl-alcohol dehydrogenase-like predicted oxidoreductase